MRCSRPCEVDSQDRANIQTLQSAYSIPSHKPEVRIVDAHIDYLERVLMRLVKARQEEAVVFPHNPEAASKRQLYLKVWKEMVAKGFEFDSKGEPVLGKPSEDSWSEKIQQMVDFGALESSIPAESAYTDEFV